MARPNRRQLGARGGEASWNRASELRNTHGHLLLLVRDRYTFSLSEVELQILLSRLIGFHRQDDTRGILEEDGWATTTLRFEPGALIVENSSEENADWVHERLLALGIAGLRRVRRDRTNPEHLIEKARRS